MDATYDARSRGDVSTDGDLRLAGSILGDNVISVRFLTVPMRSTGDASFHLSLWSSHCVSAFGSSSI
jgi:hypothetical protein